MPAWYLGRRLSLYTYDTLESDKEETMNTLISQPAVGNAGTDTRDLQQAVAVPG